jgi:hypothetical protein
MKEVGSMIPVWVYFVVSGILFSAYMAIKTGKEERQLELQAIEREGEFYMQRLEQEKEQRNQTHSMAES